MESLSPPGAGDARVHHPGCLLDEPGRSSSCPFWGVSLTPWCILLVPEHSQLSQVLAKPLSSHLPSLKSDPVAAPAQPHAAAAAARAARAALLTQPLQPPQPGLPGFVQPYKGEPVRAAPPPRSWLIIKQKQNSVGMKLDLSRACGGWGILHSFRWCLFLCIIGFFVGDLCAKEAGSPCALMTGWYVGDKV